MERYSFKSFLCSATVNCVLPVWTACRGLYWQNPTVWSSLRESMPACFLKSPFPGLPYTNRHVQGLMSTPSLLPELKLNNRCFALITCKQRHPHPVSSTTGAWSKPFSLRILMVCWQVTVGWTVRGADRFKVCSFKFHHLQGFDASLSILYVCWPTKQMQVNFWNPYTMASSPSGPPPSGSPSEPSTCHSGT